MIVSQLLFEWPFRYDHKMINASIKYQVLQIVTANFFFHCHQNQSVLLFYMYHRCSFVFIRGGSGAANNMVGDDDGLVPPWSIGQVPILDISQAKIRSQSRTFSDNFNHFHCWCCFFETFSTTKNWHQQHLTAKCQLLLLHRLVVLGIINSTAGKY